MALCWATSVHHLPDSESTDSTERRSNIPSQPGAQPRRFVGTLNACAISVARVRRCGAVGHDEVAAVYLGDLPQARETFAGQRRALTLMYGRGVTDAERVEDITTLDRIVRLECDLLRPDQSKAVLAEKLRQLGDSEHTDAGVLTVVPFAGEAARDLAIPDPTEGRVCYIAGASGGVSVYTPTGWKYLAWRP